MVVATCCMLNKGLLYAFLLAVQFGIQPLLFKRFVAPEVQKFSLIVVTEVCKIIIAGISFAAMSRKDLGQLWLNWRLVNSLTEVSPPAVLYAIQNLLVQASYQHQISSMMFNLLNQTKTLSAAFWVFMVLGKGQSRMQVLALLLLLASAIVLNLDAVTVPVPVPVAVDVSEIVEKQDTTIDSGALISRLAHGLLSWMQPHLAAVFVMAASMISGLSAALTQKVLTSSSNVNSLMVSAELAVYGIVFLVAKEVFWDLGHLSPAAAGGLLVSNFWEGWGAWTLLPVLSSALGGIIIGLVTQHAGSVMKGFALIFGLFFTGLAQWAVDGQGLKVSDWVALGLVSVSIYIHTSYPLPHPPPLNSKDKKKIE